MNLSPTQKYYRDVVRQPREVSQGWDRLPDYIQGKAARRAGILTTLRKQALAALALLRKTTASMSDEALRSELAELNVLWRRQAKHSRHTHIRSLAAISAAAQRTLGFTPHPEQLMGATALMRGMFAEMATGEGKTLAIAIAAILGGWRGYPLHVVTANDYLAERDVETMQQLFEFCGLHAGYVIGEMEPPDRRANYEYPITYTTSKELLADFLRDRIKLGVARDPTSRLIHELAGDITASNEGLVMRGIHTAIIDEADSILIDEAVTPLIISQKFKNTAFSDCCRTAFGLGLEMKQGKHYTLDVTFREVTLLPAGEAALEANSHRLPAIWRSRDRRHELIQRAIAAREFFKNGRDYVVDEDEIRIVDEYTGRAMPGRSWSQGLHQAVEAKEGVPITDPTETLASMSFQRFFRMFNTLGAISGTAAESAGELWHIYQLPVVQIPTHLPCARTLLDARFFTSVASKWDAVVEDVSALLSAGRPVLIGTRTVAASEALSERFTKAGLDHQLLNAVQHREEAAIIARAGESGQLTIATNMAGRGTDIKVPKEVQALGGLHVIVAERNASPRIDRQLIGRTGRQGEAGTARLYMSTEDELFCKYLPALTRFHVRKALQLRSMGARSLAHGAFRRAQRTTQRLGSEQRHSILRGDTWLDDFLSFSRTHRA